MNNPERRQSPRTAVAGHAYINLEPNVGGIVLNVSEGGLCFHSLDPVHRNGSARFWLTGAKKRVEAQGTVAWIDETQKAGLRFTALPGEAREQIRTWMSQSAAAEAAPAIAPRTLAFPGGEATRPAGTSARLSGFSRGLATGLLVSGVVVVAFFFQGHRREFGETLIRLGERFAEKPQVQAAVEPTQAATVTSAAALVPHSPPAEPDAPQATVSVVRTPVVNSESRQQRAQATATVPPQKQDTVVPRSAAEVKEPQPKVESARLVSTPPPTNSAPTNPKPQLVASAPPIVSPATPASGPSVAVSTPSPAKVEEAKQPEIVGTESSAGENARSVSELYFEVGKFKNQSQAHVEIDKLSRLGFPATAVQKGFLWSNSYHVLVGPYGDEVRAKATHLNLVNDGFKPRPFERGSRPFTLGAPVVLNSTHMPPGDYIISWESYLDEANVKLLHNDFTVASGNGRWVKREAKYPRDAYVYRRNADGSRTLLEIRFGGTSTALVFGKPS